MLRALPRPISAPVEANALKEAGVDETLAKGLTALASSAAGAAAGGAEGGAAAYNEVMNNYLTHTQMQRVKACLDGRTCSSKEEQEKAIREAERISKILDDNMDSVCAQAPQNDACRTAIKAAIEYVAMQDAWRYMNSDVSRSAGNTFDYLYNSDGAQPRFVHYLNTIDKRADFFQASDNYEQYIGMDAKWFGGANQVSRAPLTGLGAGSSWFTFWAGSFLPGKQYAWRDAAGNALVIGGFDNFRGLYNRDVTNSTQWDINQLKNEQMLLQPIHQQYLGDARAFVWLGQRLTDSTKLFVDGMPNPLPSSQTIPSGVNVLDYTSRVRYGCQLLGISAEQGCTP